MPIWEYVKLHFPLPIFPPVAFEWKALLPGVEPGLDAVWPWPRKIEAASVLNTETATKYFAFAWIPLLQRDLLVQRQSLRRAPGHDRVTPRDKLPRIRRFVVNGKVIALNRYRHQL